ncbi:hypothetical protein [Bacillus nitroreducens]
MGSSVFINESLARLVHKPASSSTKDPNQTIFYSNYVSEHIKLQQKHNETIKEYIKSNDQLIKKLAEKQKGLQHQFFSHELTQKNKEDQLSNKVKEQKNVLEVLVGFMRKQEKHNETTAEQYGEHKEQLEILERIVQSQEIFNRKVTENINLVKEQFDQIIASLKQHELNSEIISKQFDKKGEKEQEIVDTIVEQKELFFKVLESLQDNKEQYDILFDYVRNQDNFNHKLFEYLCSKFEEEENAVN